VKVVFDADVLVAELLLPGGKADQALAMVMAGNDQFLTSMPIMHEVLADVRI
jgi:predicted nucleic acid-binding protein